MAKKTKKIAESKIRQAKTLDCVVKFPSSSKVRDILNFDGREELVIYKDTIASRHFKTLGRFEVQTLYISSYVAMNLGNPVGNVYVRTSKRPLIRNFSDKYEKYNRKAKEAGL